MERVRSYRSGFIQVGEFWWDGFSRDELGQVHFEGFGRNPLSRTGWIQGGAGRIGNETGRRVFFFKIQKQPNKIQIISKKIKK
jgi:hypothetical protein